MQELLKSEAFRKKVEEFIRANIRAHLPGFETHDSVKAIRNEVEIAYSRGPNPSGLNSEYEAQCADYELRVARAKQVHTCELRRCLKVDRKGALVCKRRAPFEVAEDAYVKEDGTWCQERRYAYMNAWNPLISICARCNNDIKVLLNGKETVNITYYVTGYSHKNQQKNHNISAVVARNLAYHVERSKYTESLQDQQRLLLFRIVNAINSDQELAAPMVISLLMGWGDTFKSHNYTPVYWATFTSMLVKSYPELTNSHERSQSEHAEKERKAEEEITEEPFHTAETIGTSSPTETEKIPQGDDEMNGDETVTLDFDLHGKLYTPNQATDY